MKKFVNLLCLCLLALVPIAVYAETLRTELLGNLSVVSFQVYLIYAYFGVILNVISDIIRRKPDSSSSPKKFTFQYWWEDNWRRLLISIVLVPIAVLVAEEFMDSPLTKLEALGIGLAAEHLLELIKRKTKILGGV